MAKVKLSIFHFSDCRIVIIVTQTNNKKIGIGFNSKINIYIFLEPQSSLLVI